MEEDEPSEGNKNNESENVFTMDELCSFRLFTSHYEDCASQCEEQQQLHQSVKDTNYNNNNNNNNKDAHSSIGSNSTQTSFIPTTQNNYLSTSTSTYTTTTTFNIINPSHFHRSMPFNQLNPYYIYNNNTINAFHNQQHRSFPFQTTSTSHQQQQLPMNCRTTITSFKPKVKVPKEQIVPSSIHDTITTIPSTPLSSSSPASSNDVINFNTLDELLTYLKNGKQIGNYIKTRNTTLPMINLIKKLPPYELGELIEMIKPKLKEIMISNNKFCQKLFEQCTAEHRVTIFTAIEPHLSEIAFNKWGSYSLQALIKLISLPEEQEIITRFIKGRVYDLSMDKQANFVLQKLILVLNEKCLNPLIDEILLIFNHLIYNPSGVNLLKNVIQLNKNVEMKKKLVLKLNENLHNVINNPSSHVIIISIIDKWEYDIVKPLVKDVLKDIVRYSFMKISAGIVLRCISIADAKVMKHVSAVFYKAETLSLFTRSELGKEVLKHMLNKLPKKVKDDITTLMLNDVNSDNTSSNTVNTK